MKKFFKEGSDTILKLIVSQLGMTMFGIMMVFTAQSIDGSVIKVDGQPVAFGSVFLIFSLFAISFYMFLLYTHIWEKGAKDRIKVDGGRMEKQPLKGLYYSLVANSVNIILGLTMCIAYPFCDLAQHTNTVVCEATACQIYGSCNDIALLIQGMYNGAIRFFYPNSLTTPPFVFLIIVFPALICTTLGYHRGFNNKRFFAAKKPTK